MLRIGTRDSDLALWQARHVQHLLKERSGIDTELVPIKTQGDLDQVTPLAALEGKGFFTKELENALLDKRADLAVHSLKDLPTTLPPGMKVAAVFSRADRREALLIRKEAHVDRAPLPVKVGGVLGTSSARRQAQVRVLAPDLKIADLRGNVPTRVRKLREGRYDAILLAWAGISRLELDLSEFEVVLLPHDVFLPAPAQGALAIEIREDDAETEKVLSALDEPHVRRIVEAERGLLHLFAGGCKLPLGVFAEGTDEIRLAAFYGARGHDEAATGFRAEHTAEEPADVAQAVFKDLMAQKQEWAERTRALAGKTVVVTRPADKVAPLFEAIERMGGKLQPIPTLAFEPAGDTERIDAAIDELESYDWLFFTSANAVYYFLEELMKDRKLPARLKIATVGPATASAVEDAGYAVELVADRRTGVDLAQQFLNTVGAGKRVLWPTAEQARQEMQQTLVAAGVQIEPLVVYRSSIPPVEARVQADASTFDWILVTSPMAGRNFVELYGSPEGARWVAIGPTTQAEMQKLLRIPVTVAREASLEALAEVLV